MTPSKIFLYFCLSFIGGIFLSSFFAPHLLYLGGGLILGILLISVFWRYKSLVIIGFCVLFLILGIWRHQQAELKIVNSELRKLNDLNEKITLIGMISNEPDIREKSIKLKIKNEKLKIDEQLINVSGNVLVTTRRYPEYQYGDKLKITGELKTPSEDIEGFNYKDYLKKDGIYSVMGFPKFPKIELLERENYIGLTSVIFAKILSFKNKLRESIEQNLSPPQSSILAAIILGDKSKMSGCSQEEIKEAKEKGEQCLKLKEKLNIAGVRHITAVSGMHVVILSGVLMSLLVGLGLWRQQAFYFTMIFIWLFIIMTGFQPSGFRAGIMGSLLLSAQYLGRMSNSSRAIVFAAVVMLAINPLLLTLDVGFQLSFLAVMGIIYLGPILRDWLKFIPEEEFINLRSILAMTFSAQIFTLPILVYNFGQMSLVAPLTNLLILPSIYWIMIFGFIFGLAGIIFQPLGWVLSWPCWLLLTYLIKIVGWLSSFSWSAYTLEISWIWLPISYLILGLITWRLQEKRKLKFLNY